MCDAAPQCHLLVGKLRFTNGNSELIKDNMMASNVCYRSNSNNGEIPSQLCLLKLLMFENKENSIECSLTDRKQIFRQKQWRSSAYSIPECVISAGG